MSNNIILNLPQDNDKPYMLYYNGDPAKGETPILQLEIPVLAQIAVDEVKRIVIIKGGKP